MSDYSYNTGYSQPHFALSCGCAILLLVLNLALGAWSVNYLLLTFLGKVIPLGWAVIVGLFAGEFTIPAAAVVAILRSLGIL